MMCVKGVTGSSSSERRSRLRRAGLILGLIGATGFAATNFIQVIFVSRGWYGELSVFVLSSSLFLLVTLATAWKWPLIGGPMLIIGTVVMEGLPYMRGVSPVEATFLTGVLYSLLGSALVASGILFILLWRGNQVLSPEKRRKDLHRAGVVISLITVIVLIPAYLSGAFSLAMGEQTDSALLLLALLIVVLMGAVLSRRWPIVGGALLMLSGILGLFVILVTRPTFVWWSLPQLANLPLVSLLPMASGTLSLFSWREEFYIRRNHKESSRKLSELERKDIVANCKNS
ncbi:MAG: hypothetical protein ACFFCO_10570 [Promethearchaeota archaeon]